MDNNNIVGHKTVRTGLGEVRHDPLTKEESDSVWQKIESEKARLAEAMPTQEAAVRAMYDAYERLKALGWKEPPRFTTAGSFRMTAMLVEMGCTRSIEGYSGTLKDGRITWWSKSEDGDVWPVRPVLILPLQEQPHDN
jgi:hypothetical protein